MINIPIFILMPHNGWYMKSKRFRSTKLSIYKNVETGYKPRCYYYFAYFLYTLLQHVFLSSFSSSF